MGAMERTEWEMMARSRRRGRLMGSMKLRKRRRKLRSRRNRFACRIGLFMYHSTASLCSVKPNRRRARTIDRDPTSVVARAFLAVADSQSRRDDLLSFLQSTSLWVLVLLQSLVSRLGCHLTGSKIVINGYIVQGPRV